MTRLEEIKERERSAGKLTKFRLVLKGRCIENDYDARNFFCNAREDILWLISQVERLESKIKAANAYLKDGAHLSALDCLKRSLEGK